MFKYIHKPKAVTMLHTLPFSRTTLFFGQIISGLFLMFTPVILNGIVLLILNQTTFLNEIYTIPQVLIFTGYIMLFETLVFSTTVFIGMLTGNSIVHFILTYLFHLVPIVIYYIATNFLSYMLIGFTNLNSAFFDTILLNTPLIKGFSIFSEAYSSGPLINRFEAKVPTIELIIYICAILLFIGVALLLYKKRKLDTATDIISFNVIRPIFKYGITFALMTIGGIFIMSINLMGMGDNPMGIINQFAPSIPSLLIWSFIGYCIAEMLLRKSFNIWRSYKGFFVYSAIIIALFLMISNDVFGFVNRVPNVNDVQSVYLGDKVRWEEKDNPSVHNNGDPSWYEGTTFTEPKNIEYVEKLHKQLIKENYTFRNNIRYKYDYLYSNDYLFTNNQLFIIYTLKNGLQLIRSYQSDMVNSCLPLDYGGHGDTLLEPLLSSSEYKLKNNIS